jgi:hypothetical protein
VSSGPGELRTAIGEDYALKPVPRELVQYRKTGGTRS